MGIPRCPPPIYRDFHTPPSRSVAQARRLKPLLFFHLELHFEFADGESAPDRIIRGKVPTIKLSQFFSQLYSCWLDHPQLSACHRRLTRPVLISTTPACPRCRPRTRAPTPSATMPTTTACVTSTVSMAGAFCAALPGLRALPPPVGLTGRSAGSLVLTPVSACVLVARSKPSAVMWTSAFPCPRLAARSRRRAVAAAAAAVEE